MQASKSNLLHFRILKPALALMLSAAALVCAAATKPPPEPAVSAWTAQRLNQANEYLAQEDYNSALEKLNSLLSSLEDDAYEAALTYQAIAFTHALQEQYAQAIPYFEKALPGLAPSQKQSQKTRFDLGQLYMAEQQYLKAVPVLNAWLQQADSPSAQVHVLLAHAHAQLEQPKQALPHAQKAIALADSPVEAWYQLLLALYLELEDYPASVKLLPEMIGLFPENAAYWKQLGALHLQLKHFKQAAAALEIAWQQKLLTTEQELLSLANLFFYNNIPEKAARLLAQALDQGHIEHNEKHWQLSGEAWLMSREIEPAIEAFKQAAALADHGNIHERIAGLYIDLNQWQPAKDMLQAGLKKGGLKNPGQAYLLLGIAELELKASQSAEQAFLQALKFEDSRKAAGAWLSHLSVPGYQ